VKILTTIALLLTLLLSTGCSSKKTTGNGVLFIIGGGEKTMPMMNELADLAGVRTGGYVYVLPMASSIPDSAIIWSKEDFGEAGIKSVFGYVFKRDEVPPVERLDSLRNAKLIFISGGDQSRFMEIARNSPIHDAILEAYSKGAVIAGTSAGAAVMSRRMITGNQKLHPLEEGTFRTIEAGNIEITDGLGLLENVIIDQHFVKRQRLNRLVAVSIEFPDALCIGIDESTAVVVSNSEARVTGVGQVVVLRNNERTDTIREGLLGTKGLDLKIYLPGESFSLKGY
jgi:cyanophycinase